MKIKFVETSKIWITISVVVILLGIGFAVFRGLNIGIDFSGGSLLYANIGKDYNVEDIREIVAKNGISADVIKAGDAQQDVIIRMQDTEGLLDIQKQIISDLQEKYNLTADQFNIDTVGATIGGELVKNALMSLAIAFILMLAYIWFRFELLTGAAAIVALFHDILVMFAAVAILRVPINSSFVAALLTIVGYSINNTIVVFDRVRENRKRFGKKISNSELVNKSINESIARSINTSLTTLFTITMVYILGVESVKEFALPLIVGLIAGTYSSLFIAGPLWAWWSDLSVREKASAAK